MTGKIEHLTLYIVLPTSAPFISSPLNSAFISAARLAPFVGGKQYSLYTLCRFPQGGFALILFFIISGIMHETWLYKMKREGGGRGLVAIRLYYRCFICSRKLSFDYFAHLSQDSGRHKHFVSPKTHFYHRVLAAFLAWIIKSSGRERPLTSDAMTSNGTIQSTAFIAILFILIKTVGGKSAVGVKHQLNMTICCRCISSGPTASVLCLCPSSFLLPHFLTWTKMLPFFFSFMFTFFGCKF